MKTDVYFRNKEISLYHFCEKLKKYFSSLNMNIVIENKLFWKMVRPFLSNKTISSEKITLIDDDELIADEQKVANSFNDFFSSLVTI